MISLSQKHLCLLAAALLLLCGCSPTLRGRPNVTVPPIATAAYSETLAADIRLTDTDGNTVSLLDYLGKPVLLQFWPDGNGLTEAELDMMQRAYESNGENIIFLLVCPEPPMPPNAFSERGLLPLLYFDPEQTAAEIYNAKQTPATIFIDADGFIAAQSEGSISEDALLFGLKLL